MREILYANCSYSRLRVRLALYLGVSTLSRWHSTVTVRNIVLSTPTVYGNSTLRFTVVASASRKSEVGPKVIGWGLVFRRARNFYHLIDSAVTTNFYCFNMSLKWPLLPIFIPFPQISLSAHYVRAVRDPREQAQGTHNTHVQAPQSAHVHMCIS